MRTKHIAFSKANAYHRTSTKRGDTMINFEEELKKFKPSLEVEDIEEAVYHEDLTDIADIVREAVQQSK